MGSGDDLIIIAAVATPIIAYAGNFGGFRTWVDQQVAAQPTTPTGPTPCVKIGSNCQICRNKGTAIWQGICRGQLSMVETAGPYPKDWSDSKACNSIRQIFLNKCNAGSGTGAPCPYAGCTGPAGPGCFQCRCRGICKGHPNTYPVTSANGSCICRKMAGASQAYEERYSNVTVA